MKELLKKLLIATLLVCVATTAFACGGKNNSSADIPDDSEQQIVVKDSVSPRILVDYEYKIVLVGQTVTLPQVSFDEEVTQTHQLNGESVLAGSTFTANEVGTVIYKITATDTAGNKSVKEIYYSVTNNAQDLNKIYAIDTVAGLTKQVGSIRNGVNNLALYLISESSERPVDLNNKQVPDLYLDASGDVVSDASLAHTTVSNYLKANLMTGGGTECRMVLGNPLYKNWDEHFSQIYFYVYNAGIASTTVYFNNYAYTIAPNSGWQKVVIAPKEVDGKIVTDFTKISSLGGSFDYAGMFDLEDCVGATIRLVCTDRYERVMLTAIYGVPKNG